ncbi:MAG: hypothetical protein EBZ50_01580 [Alphaproteobacteria bacterium]|nr:hypothetical protein [Alphaproteobacteria bacterium]
MTVAAVPTGAGNFTAQTTFTLSVPGRKLLMGTTTPSYTFELRYPDISVSELFTGCRIGGANISIPPNGNAQVQFSVLGRDQQLLTSSSSPYFSSPTAAPTTGILTGIEGGIRLAGVEQTIITSLQLQISLNLRADPVIGTPLVPEIFYGRSVVTGSVTFFLQDETLLNVYANETEADLVAVALAAGSEPRDFISFSMQRIKLTGAQKSFDADGGVVVTSPFQALLQSGSTVKDTSTLVIQRSN